MFIRGLYSIFIKLCVFIHDNMIISGMFCYPEKASRLMLASCWSLQVCFFDMKQCFRLVGLETVVCCSVALSDVVHVLNESL